VTKAMKDGNFGAASPSLASPQNETMMKKIRQEKREPNPQLPLVLDKLKRDVEHMAIHFDNLVNKLGANPMKLCEIRAILLLFIIRTKYVQLSPKVVLCHIIYSVRVDFKHKLKTNLGITVGQNGKYVGLETVSPDIDELHGESLGQNMRDAQRFGLVIRQIGNTDVTDVDHAKKLLESIQITFQMPIHACNHHIIKIPGGTIYGGDIFIDALIFPENKKGLKGQTPKTKWFERNGNLWFTREECQYQMVTDEPDFKKWSERVERVTTTEMKEDWDEITKLKEGVHFYNEDMQLDGFEDLLSRSSENRGITKSFWSIEWFQQFLPYEIGETVYSLIERDHETEPLSFGDQGTVKGPAEDGDKRFLVVNFEDPAGLWDVSPTDISRTPPDSNIDYG